MGNFTTYLPSIVAALVALAGIFAAPIQDLITAHPTAAVIIAALYSIFAHLVPSPVAKPAS